MSIAADLYQQVTIPPEAVEQVEAAAATLPREAAAVLREVDCDGDRVIYGADLDGLDPADVAAIIDALHGLSPLCDEVAMGVDVVASVDAREWRESYGEDW